MKTNNNETKQKTNSIHDLIHDFSEEEFCEKFFEAVQKCLKHKTLASLLDSKEIDEAIDEIYKMTVGDWNWFTNLVYRLFGKGQKVKEVNIKDDKFAEAVFETIQANVIIYSSTAFSIGFEYGLRFMSAIILEKYKEIANRIAKEFDKDVSELILIAFFKFLFGKSKLDEWEKEVIKVLRRAEYSIHEIARILDRSTYTIHTVLRND